MTTTRSTRVVHFEVRLSLAARRLTMAQADRLIQQHFPSFEVDGYELLAGRHLFFADDGSWIEIARRGTSVTIRHLRDVWDD